ncbi:hypothetical protein FHL15_005468 [Xylaria flabelliformis]|uniref:Uncharacterized protein n=1 Tax=Xylaria flabelliformis TaxID=2512241 RepID=A0A553HZW2_9PEZI|nr:hypothetical protein FHL15_005468 [Xylaria flabelliformis]
MADDGAGLVFYLPPTNPSPNVSPASQLYRALICTYTYPRLRNEQQHQFCAILAPGDSPDRSRRQMSSLRQRTRVSRRGGTGLGALPRPREALGRHFRRGHLELSPLRAGRLPFSAHLATPARRDRAIVSAATAAHDNTDLSAEETLRQLARLANTAARRADPACLAEAFRAAEYQQQALHALWPRFRTIDRETAGWNSRLQANLEGLGRQHWWIRKTDEVYIDGDSGLKAVQKEKVFSVLLPFVAAWRLASQNHETWNAVCKDCA